MSDAANGGSIKGNSSNNQSSNNKTETAMNVADLDTAAKMLDRLSRIGEKRRIAPLSMHDYIAYNHRIYQDDYGLQIGDVWFLIPPEFIMITSESQTGKIVTLRQENTQKTKSGYHRRTIMIDLVVHGSDQINGYKVESPTGFYYVDGLRPLLAQFKRTPFLPIFNELINDTYGIQTVALQSITIQTVENFPSIMTAQITLQEVNMMPYIEMHSLYFQYMIDWDLMRFYYQSALTEIHEYKKLQSIPINQEENHVIMRSLNAEVLEAYKHEKDSDRSKFLNIITDKDNYDILIDSSTDNFHVVSFSCNYSNMLVNIQMSEADSPTVQFMGGMDTIYNIVLETKDKNIVTKIEQGRINNDYLTRANAKLRALGFVMLESELVELTGSLFVMIDTITTNTVPGFPGLYNIQITCVAYDIGQSEREQLEGFRPFDKEEFDAAITGEQNVNGSTFDGSKYLPKGYDLVVGVQDKYTDSQGWKNIKIIEQYYYENCSAIEYISSFPPEESNWVETGTKLDGPNPDNSYYVLQYKDSKDGTTVYYDTIDHLLYLQKNIGDSGFQDSNFVSEQIKKESDEGSYYDSYKENQCIDQSETGVHTKIMQDLYAENQIRTKMEVYPDLHLPTYEEVNKVIRQISDFRNTHEGLSPYPLESYPFQPYNVLYGCLDEINSLGDMFHPSDIQVSNAEYKGYVDPDFYVFYVSYDEYKKDIQGERPLLGERNFTSRADATNSNNAAAASRYIGNDPIDLKMAPDGLVKTACSIINGVESKAKYDTVVSDNDTPLAIGKYQFRGQKAIELLQDMINTNYNLAVRHLGETFIKYIQQEDHWGNQTLNSTQKKSIENFLKEESLYSVQESKIYSDMADAMEYAISQGLTDGKALIFYADCEHQLGRAMANPILANGLKGYGNGGPNSLDALYQYSIKDPKGNDNERRNSVYDTLKNINVGAVSSALDSKTSNVYQLYDTDKINMVDAAYYLIQGDVDACGDDLNKIQMCIAQCFFDNYVEGGLSFNQTWSHFLNSSNPGITLTNGNINTNGYKNFKESMLKVIDDVFLNQKKAPGFADYSIHIASNINAGEETNYDACASEIKDKFDILYPNFVHKHNIDKVNKIATYSGIRFWGCKKPSPTDVVFVTAGEEAKVVTEQINSETSTQNPNYNIETFGPSDTKYFGESLIVRTSKLNQDASFVSNNVNNYKDVYNSCFSDMYQYSGRGRLVRAFPAFLFCILDDQSQWFDGRKLWTNYYVYQSVTDIQIHSANDMPTDTAVITITNSANNLGKTQAGLSGYTVSSDPAYLNSFTSWFYKRTGLIIGGIKITDKMIELHNILYDHARLREGARVHLRIGYGSDPFSLAPMINGHISDITIGDQITMVVTSDGHELLQTVMSAKTDVNNGFLGLFGWGATQEASNLIAKMMVERSSWMTHLHANWFEASKYGIEHFGIYFHDDGIFDTFANWKLVEEIWNEAKEHWDILMNIYIANYRKELYCPGTSKWFIDDDEKNFMFNRYNMVPWDLAQLCAQQAPEYICKVLHHQFDSRLFFGLPSYMERYRYDFFGGTPKTVTKTETKRKVKTKTVVIPAQHTVSGNKEDSGHFTETNYDSQKQPPNPPAGQEMKEVIFSLQLKGHSLATFEEKKDPDVMRIYGYKEDGTEVLLASTLSSDNAKCNLTLVDFEDELRTVRVSGDALKGIKKVRFDAHCQHKRCCERNSECLEWQIIYGDEKKQKDEVKTVTEVEDETITKEELDWEDILYEECKAAGQVHYLESLTNIIDDQVRVTNKFSNTNVKCMYIRGHSAVSTSLIKSDDTIDSAYQKTAIIDTPLVQNYIGPDFLYEPLSITQGKKVAKRVGISNLLYGWQQQYQGELILFGSPGIKPHDYLMINDVFSNLYGVCICREITHSFNSSTGFTTSVTPGMIGFDTQENTGLVSHCQNLLVTLNAFSMLVTTRLYDVHLMEQYIAEISNQLTVLNKACELLKASQDSAVLINNIRTAVNIATLGAGIYRVVRVAGGIKGLPSHAMAIAKTITGAFSNVAKVSGIVKKGGALLRGLATVGPKTVAKALGLNHPIGWVILIGVIVMKKVANVIFDYLSDRNCVVLMPLLWEGYPFVSGVKDGEKILLVPNNSVGTNENDKSDGNYNKDAADVLSKEQLEQHE